MFLGLFVLHNMNLLLIDPYYFVALLSDIYGPPPVNKCTSIFGLIWWEGKGAAWIFLNSKLTTYPLINYTSLYFYQTFSSIKPCKGPGDSGYLILIVLSDLICPGSVSYCLRTPCRWPWCCILHVSLDTWLFLLPAWTLILGCSGPMTRFILARTRWDYLYPSVYAERTLLYNYEEGPDPMGYSIWVGKRAETRIDMSFL